jgi:hypothetical protein
MEMQTEKSMALKLNIFLITFCLVSTSEAADWICKEAASQRQGEAIMACGIGVAKDEATARILALKEAKREFDSICSESADCKGHALKVTPLRNDCQTRNGRVECYRGVRFEISSALRDASNLKDENYSLDNEIRAAEFKLHALREVKEKQRKLAELNKQVQAGGNIDVSSNLAVEPTDVSLTEVRVECMEAFVAGFGSRTDSILIPGCSYKSGVNHSYKMSSNIFQEGVMASCGYLDASLRASQDAEAKYHLKPTSSQRLSALVSKCKRTGQEAMLKLFGEFHECTDVGFANSLFKEGKYCGDLKIGIESEIYSKTYEQLCVSKKRSKKTCAGDSLRRCP